MRTLTGRRLAEEPGKERDGKPATARSMAVVSQPLPLILARNLVETMSVASFVVSSAGELVFFNEAAGDLIGKRFEEIGHVPRERWNEIGPFAADGTALNSEGLPLTLAVKEGTPAHGRFYICTDEVELVEVDVAAFPLADEEGFHGAVVLFWPTNGKVPG
jgi:PAS domain-containing protein